MKKYDVVVYVNVPVKIQIDAEDVQDAKYRARDAVKDGMGYWVYDAINFVMDTKVTEVM